MVKKTTTAEMMARDSCDQKEIQAIRLQSNHQSWQKRLMLLTFVNLYQQWQLPHV